MNNVIQLSDYNEKKMNSIKEDCKIRVHYVEKLKENCDFYINGLIDRKDLIHSIKNTLTHVI